MAEGWRPVFSGVVDGRWVDLRKHYPSGELSVETSQSETKIVPGFVDGNFGVLPEVIKKGSVIYIGGKNSEDLRKNLLENGFSEEGAEELIRLAAPIDG